MKNASHWLLLLTSHRCTIPHEDVTQLAPVHHSTWGYDSPRTCAPFHMRMWLTSHLWTISHEDVTHLAPVNHSTWGCNSPLTCAPFHMRMWLTSHLCTIPHEDVTHLSHVLYSTWGRYTLCGLCCEGVIHCLNYAVVIQSPCSSVSFSLNILWLT